jgi:hypothetical protein
MCLVSARSRSNTSVVIVVSKNASNVICGAAEFVGAASAEMMRGAPKAMVKSLRHRVPDSEGM